jgi:hypothetical protein
MDTDIEQMKADLRKTLTDEMDMCRVDPSNIIVG